MKAFIRAALSNPSITFFLVGLVASAIAIARMPASRTAGAVFEALLRWFIFFSIGCAMFYNFVMHVFFGAMAARFIGWADSPFQAEVGLASLGFAVIAFIAFRGDWQVRLASIAGPACFLAGAGIGHVFAIATTHNMAPGNAGVVLYADFLVPAAGFLLLWLAHRTRRQ